MTVSSLRKLKKIIIYCVSTFFIFSLSLLLMISYEFYLKIVNDNNKASNKDSIQQPTDQQKQSTIERLDHVKVGYKENKNDDPHIFVVDVLKIGKCKYILVHSHINNYTDIELVHANDCEQCSVNDKNYHEISKQLLEIIAKKELEKVNK